MCGICGLVTPTGASLPVTERTVLTMRETLVHRGPDDAGIFVGPGVGLGFRRLSIVDLALGHQPMTSPDGRYVIVYNGEIYNHPALKAELEANGVRYRTRCDTETILQLFVRLGPAAVSELRGMFAFAIWDVRERRLFLARDRFGVKPLYYLHRADGSLWFASEIKGLLAGGAIPPALNVGALPDYLANHAPSGTETLFEGVKRLPAGHTLVWNDGAVTISQYWDLNPDPVIDTRPDRQLIGEYLERLRESVRLRLMADVPLGVFLSGGIDSAAITALMAPMVSEPVKSFSVAFREREANELSFARIVAQRYGTDHHEVLVSPEQFFGAVPRLVWHEDEPMAHPSSVALNFVSRLAAEHVKVVLTGEGSDETLAGYGRYRTALLNLRLGGPYERAVPLQLRRAIPRLFTALSARSRLRRRLNRSFLALPATIDSLYLDNFAVFSREAQAGLLSPGLWERLAKTDPYAAFRPFLDRVPSASLLNRLLYADLKTYLHELLMKQDQMSMAASIESRVPFLDHPLVEFSMTLPAHLKLRGRVTKVVLREAMRNLLPDPILTRRKMGFPVPVGSWLRGGYRALLDEFLTGPRASQRGLFNAAAVRKLVAGHLDGEPGHEERLWSLFNLEIWQRIFLDGEPVESVQGCVDGARRAA